MGAHLAALPWPGGVAKVDAIGRSVLADHQQFLGAGGDQFLGLAQDRVGAAADEVAADRRDDAEGAAVVAALGNLQIAVVARGQLEPGFGHQVEEGVGHRRRGFVDRGDDFLILLRAGDREHAREARADHLGFLAQAAGDDHAAVLGDRFADRFQALGLGAVEEAAGVDQHHVGPGIVGRHVVAVGAQLGHDPLAVDQGLGTAERNQAHARGSRKSHYRHRKERASSRIFGQKRGVRRGAACSLGKRAAKRRADPGGRLIRKKIDGTDEQNRSDRRRRTGLCRAAAGRGAGPQVRGHGLRRRCRAHRPACAPATTARARSTATS